MMMFCFGLNWRTFNFFLVTRRLIVQATIGPLFTGCFYLPLSFFLCVRVWLEVCFASSFIVGHFNVDDFFVRPSEQICIINDFLSLSLCFCGLCFIL